MQPLKKDERQYVAYYVMNILSDRIPTGHSWQMKAPSGELRMQELRLLAVIVADLQKNDD